MTAKKSPLEELEKGEEATRRAYLIQPLMPSKKEEASLASSMRDEKAPTSRDENLESNQQVPIHTVQFRETSRPEKRWNRWIWILLALVGLLLLTLGLGYMLTKRSPSAQKWVHKRLQVLREKHVVWSDFLALPELEKKLLSWYAPGSERAATRPWREMDCRFLIEEALSRKLNKTLDSEGRYLLVACQLSQDMPQVALRLAQEAYGETAGIKQGLSNWADARVQLIAGEARYRLHALEAQAPRRFNKCRQWSATPDCLVRLVDEARQPLLVKQDKAFPVLEGGLKKATPDVRAWFYWAGGLSSMKAGRVEEAENRLQKGVQLLGETYDPFLERALFKARVQNAWQFRDAALMRKVWNDRPKKRLQDDPLAFLDSRLMYKSLSNPQEGLKELNGFLQQGESYLRFRYDPLFVRWIIEQSILSGQVAGGRQYLERLTEAAGLELKSSEWLATLSVRIDLAEHKGIDALKTLQNLERYMRGSALLHHLRGLAMLEGFSSKEFRLRAAQEFQRAVNSDGNPESYLALVVSFLEADAIKKAEATVNFWQKQKVSEADKKWLGFAKTMVLRQAGKNVEADRQWSELRSRNPDFELFRKYDQNLRVDSNLLENRLFKSLQQLLGPYGPFGPLVYVGQRY